VNISSKENNQININHKSLNEDMIFNILNPETALEHKFLQIEEFRDGLTWGQPRFGHPEGKVVYHIREVLDNIEKLPISAIQRERLRTITFAHDTFKYKEDKNTPRDWSKHHSILARLFLEQYTDDEAVLTVTEVHDEAYYCWRMMHLHKEEEAAQKRLDYLLQRLGDNLQLFYLFFKIDTQTGDKTQAPINWFEKTIKGIDIVKF